MFQAFAVQTINQAITKFQVAPTVQMVAPIQLVVKIPVLVGEYTDEVKSSLGSEPYFLVTSFGLVFSINTPTTTALNGSQPMMQLANGTNETDDYAKNALIDIAYTVFLLFSVLR